MLYHNKKRNVGLLNDFFARYIANALVEQNHKGIEKATDLYKKYFSKETQIAKEWNLFRGLYETNVSSKEIAVRLIEKVKSYAGEIKADVLESEKTKLIHEINMTLGDKDFFKRAVTDYRLQATVQVLLNNWREKKLTESLSEMANLENVLLEHMVAQKANPPGTSTYLEMDNVQIDEEIDSLVVGLMSEKFNSKYNEELFEEQRAIVSNYIFAGDNAASRTALTKILDEVRSKTLTLVEGALTDKKIGEEVLSEHLSKKFVGIKNLLLNEYKNTSNLNDATVTFYMTLIKLQKELTHE
jgi:hypothetical protein